MRTLDPQRIDLWMTFLEEPAVVAAAQSYCALLNEGERAQQRRFMFAKDRHRYLVTRALVRCTLSKYLPVDPVAWEFAENHHGRPHIANKDVEHHDVTFNVSHTDGLVVMAVGAGIALGVDAENHISRKAPVHLANHYFAPEEARALLNESIGSRAFRFFEYWTLKESYIKARGMGLSIPLDKFAFRFSGDSRVAMSVDPELNDDVANWRYWQFQPTMQHVVSLCAQRTTDAVPSVTPWRTVPMRCDLRLAEFSTRTSG